MGASLVIGVDGDEARLDFAKKMGVDVVLNYNEQTCCPKSKN